MPALSYEPRKAALLALTGFGAYACADALNRVLVHGGQSVFQVGALVQLVGVVALLFAHKPLGHLSSLWKTKRPWLHVVRGLLFFTMPLNVYAFSVLPFTLVYSLLFTNSFWNYALSTLVIGERLSWRSMGAVALGLVGTLIVLHPWDEGFDWRLTIPLCSAVLSAVRMLLERKMGATETPLAMAVLPSFLSTPLLLVIAASLGDLSVPSGPSDWGFLLLSGALGAVGLLCLPLAFKHAPITIVGPFHYTQLVWGGVIGYLFFQQIPQMTTLIGGGIIVAAGLSVVLRRQENPPKT